jgi:large subunit ribosomal protein L22
LGELEMVVTSTYRYARISAFKARELTREIQGLSASDALDLLRFSPKKAAVMVRKTLKSAIANAENNANLKVDTLLVKEAVIGEGPTLKRFRARARGSASPLRKRTSHIRIVLADELVPAAYGGKSQKTRGAQRAETSKQAAESVKMTAHRSSDKMAAKKADASETEAVSDVQPTPEKEN